MTQEFTISLPHFCGFYESFLLVSDTLYNELSNGELEYLREYYGNEELDYKDFDMNYDRYCDDCATVFCGVFWDKINDCIEGLVENVEFVEVDSPREYNFRTDEVIAKVTLCGDWKEKMVAFMEENEEWLSERIREDWTSCSGFISFMDNTYNDWLLHIKGDDTDNRYVEGMLGYILYRNDEDVTMSMTESVWEKMNVSEYIYLTEDAKARYSIEDNDDKKEEL